MFRRHEGVLYPVLTEPGIGHKVGAMKLFGRMGRIVYFFVLAVSLAVFVHLRRRAPEFSFRLHVFLPSIISLLVSAAIVILLLAGLWALASQIWTKNSQLKYKEALALDLPTFGPILFFLAAPLALSHYLDRDDLQIRLGLLAAGVVAAVLYLKAAQIVRAERQGKSKWAEKTVGRFVAWPLRRRIAALFVVSLALYGGGALLINGSGVSFGGDEPHYLLMTHSLLKDGDLELSANYERRDFEAYTAPQAPIRPHQVPGRKPGRQYSFHSPGVSILLLPFYALGLAFGKGALVFLIRFGMAFFGALLGIQIYLYARAEWGREKLALGLWALAGFTAPFFFYSLHVYPELIVALFSLTAFRLLRFSPRLTTGRIILIGLLLSSLVWFHALKYFFLQGPLFLIAFVAVWKKSDRTGRLSRLACLLAPSAGVFGLYFLFQVALYGSLNPTSVSWQGAMDGRQSLGFLKDLFTGIPFRFRWETLAGYFLDQKDGLLLYAPVYFSAFLGLAEIFRRKAKDAWLLLFVAGPYVLVSAFLTQRTGYAPQARPLVAVMWVLVIFLGYFLADGRKRIFRVLFYGDTALSLLFVWLLLKHPFALYQETTAGTTERAGDLFISLSNLHLYLPKFLPSFLKVEKGGWLPNVVWLAGLAAFVLAYLVVRKHDFRLPFGAHAAIAGVLLASFAAMYVLFPRAVLMSPRPAALATGDKWTFYSLSRVARMDEPARFSILQDNRDYNFYFATRRPFDALEVEFGSDHGDYDLACSLFDQPAFEAPTRGEVLTRTVKPMVFYRWKGAWLARVSIRLERRSAVDTAVKPYLFAIRPAR
jgi:hypothetical protein